jgi:4-diphosphocytidyl-2-C-methyl-D-erythritol kinase
MLGSGRGDIVVPLIDRPVAWVTLIIPAFGVETRQAYAWFDQVSPRRRVGNLRRRDEFNDLQMPVSRHHPEIARFVRALRRLGAGRAAMSGSGSVVFGLFGSRLAAEAAARAMARRAPRVVVTQTLTRARFRWLSRARWP